MKTITTTEYNYDTENGTTTIKRVIPLFEYYELNEDAQNRVISEYAIERENDPYFTQYFVDCYESEIWECVHALENSIACADVKWNYNRWYSCDFDCEYKIKDIDWLEPDTCEPVKNTGYYASMDITETWNAHVRKLNALATMYGNLCDQIIELPYEEWEFFAKPENRHFCEKLEKMKETTFDNWIIELEKACDDVRDTIETLLRGEWDYYTSEEYSRIECEDETTQGGEYRTRDNAGRVYYSDNRKWYTKDGELFEQSDIDHVCISIVKIS